MRFRQVIAKNRLRSEDKISAYGRSFPSSFAVRYFLFLIDFYVKHVAVFPGFGFYFR